MHRNSFQLKYEVITKSLDHVKMSGFCVCFNENVLLLETVLREMKTFELLITLALMIMDITKTFLKTFKRFCPFDP